LMERMPDKTFGKHNVGPENHRFGAWARVLPAGESMHVNANEQFASSLNGFKILVTYLDQTEKGRGTFRFTAGSAEKTIKLKNSQKWQTVSIGLKSGSLTRGSTGSHISITAGPEPLILHMVEVLRK